MSETLAERIDARFFAAADVDGRVHVRGVPESRFGHRLPAPAGGNDDGIFAEWHWDGRRLTVSGDRYGMLPLFICSRDDAVWVSPSIVTLIREGAPPELDEGHLGVFLRLGYFLGDATPFRFIRALPPQATLSWEPGTISWSSRRSMPAVNPLAREAAIDAYIELFRDSLRRRSGWGDPIILPLSGGRDSRHTLLELIANGHRPTGCVTMRYYPPRPDEDARIATILTTTFGLPHQVLDPLPRFDAELAKNVATSFCADEHAWAMALADSVRGEKAAIFDGIGGDVLSAGLFVTPARQALADAGKLGELAESLLPMANEATIAWLVDRGLLPPLPRAAAVERVATELAAHVDAPNPIGSYIFWNRTRREINLIPYALYAPAGPVYAPYLDHALFDLLASLPVSLMLDHQLHSDVIRRAYPAYRDIPFQNPLAPRRDVGPLGHEIRQRLVAYAAADRLPIDAGDLTDQLSLEQLLYILQLRRIPTTARQSH